MAMQINGSYGQTQTDYMEKVREKQAQKAKEAEKKAGEEKSGALSEPRDEYIRSEKSGKGPTGLYRVEQDENGNRKISYDDPKAASANGKAPKAEEDNKEEPETCVGDTNAVDREIRKLREKRQELEQQLQSASGDEKKTRELERKLAQVDQELSQKDNDAYRRQHTVFSAAK